MAATTMPRPMSPMNVISRATKLVAHTTAEVEGEKAARVEPPSARADDLAVAVAQQEAREVRTTPERDGRRVDEGLRLDDQEREPGEIVERHELGGEEI